SGVWKRDVTPPAQPHASPHEQAAAVQRQTKAIREVTQKLTAGAYKSLNEVPPNLRRAGFSSRDPRTKTPAVPANPAPPPPPDMAVMARGLSEERFNHLISCEMAQLVLGCGAGDLEVV